MEIRKLVINLIKKLIPKYLFAIFIGIILDFFIIGATFISKLYIDTIVPSENRNFLFLFIISYISFYLVKSFFSYMKEVLFAKYGYSLLFEIRGKFHEFIVKQVNVDSLSSEKQSYIITLFKDWLNSISWFLSNIFLNTITDLVFLIIACVFVIKTNIQIFLTLFCTFPIYGVIYFFFNKYIRTRRNDVMDADVEVTKELMNTINGIKDIRLLNVERQFINRYFDVQSKYINRSCNYIRLSSFYECAVSLVSALGHTFVLLFGTLLLFDKSLSVGTIISINTLVTILYTPIEKIVNFNRLYQIFVVEYDKLKDFVISSRKYNYEKSNKYMKLNDNELLRIENLSFAYKDIILFENVNLSFEKGKCYAIVGNNGTGKSTLIDVVLGIKIPKVGDVFWKNNSIFTNLDLFHKNIGYVSKDSFFLNASIRENIIFSREIIDVQYYNKILQLCEIDKIMIKNNISEDFIIGENGSKLSAGEKQKIAICRALYHKPELLVFDEGTDSIDPETELKIIDNIRNHFPEIVIIMITHRLSTTYLCDKIIVLHHSKIAESGTTQELLEKKSFFYSIFYKESEY